MTLIPDLERDLVEAAGRVRAPRGRARRLAPVAAAAAGVVALAIAAGGLLSDDASRDPVTPPSGEQDREAPAPPPPSRRPEPLPGSLSKPVRFEFDGVRYRTFGFRGRRFETICLRLTRTDTMPGISGETCAGERSLRRGLRRGSVLQVGAGGGAHMSITGFTRADVTGLVLRGTTRPHRIVLTDPWSPEPWRGEPIRAFLAMIKGSPDRAVPHRKLLQIRVVPAIR